MTAKKKQIPIPTTRYRRRDQIVDVLEGAAVLNHSGTFPEGVTQAEGGGGLLFQGVPILESTYLVYDELGNPINLFAAQDFKDTYDADFDAHSTTELKGDLAQAKTMVAKFEDELLTMNSTVDELRAENKRLQSIIDAQAIAADEKRPTDNATGVLRDILRIEAAQTRDDGGRIIHLNRKIIERAVAVV